MRDRAGFLFKFRAGQVPIERTRQDENVITPFVTID